MRYENPFKFDPFAAVYEAFKRLYPGKECLIHWDSDIEDEDDEPVFGVTCFSPDEPIEIRVNPCLAVGDAVEVLAHELAHVAAGVDADHDKKWEKAFDAIQEECMRIFWEVKRQ